MSHDLELGLRLLSLTIAVAALGGAGTRISNRLTVRADLRVISAASVGAAAAVAEAVVLGLFGVGANVVALLAASVVMFLVVRWRVPVAAGPRLSQQLGASLRGLRIADAAGVGALLVGGLSAMVDLMWRPYTPYDGLQYHLAEPVLWLADGHPGTLHAVSTQTPFQAYPRNTEVLLSWLLGLSHSFVIGTPLMFALFALALVAMVSALRSLRVEPRYAVVLTVAVLTMPVSVLQLAGASTDVATLAWIVATAALCFGAVVEPALLPIAFLAGGLAVGTKASAAVPVVVGLVVTLWVLRRRLLGGGVPLACGAVVGIGLGALWYLQDWVVYGAPLYPFSRFPSGPVLPQAITDFNTSFAQHPIAALRAGTFHGYLVWDGGGPFLIAAAVLAILSVPLLRRDDRRVMVGCVAAAVAALLVWAIGPFTGYPAVVGTKWFPLNGIRYLLPSMPIVVLPLAVLGRGRHWLRLVVTAGLVAVVVVNIYELRNWPAPVRPPAAYVAGGLVVGAALGGWVASWWARRVTVRRQPSYGAAYGAATVIAVTALLGVFADGYVGREVKQQPRPGDDPFRVASVIGWLDRQPEWADGDQPVAAGPIVDALLAGPRLTHHLTLIPQTESCASVRALHVGHWLVFAKSIVVASGPYQFITYTRADCITGPPSYADGHYLVYRPANRS